MSRRSNHRGRKRKTPTAAKASDAGNTSRPHPESAEGRSGRPQNPLPPQHDAVDPGQDDGHVLSFLLDILDKQYRNYAWNDTKMQALITADSILFAVIGFLFASCLPDLLALLLLIGGALLVSLSLIHCLLHAIPRLMSGKSGPNDNPRAISGITSASPDWEHYVGRIQSLSADDIVAHTARQVYGMAVNNITSHKRLRVGVRTTVIAVVLILLSMGAAILSAHDLHVLGAGPGLTSDSTSEVERTSDATAASPEPSSDLQSDDETIIMPRSDDVPVEGVERQSTREAPIGAQSGPSSEIDAFAKPFENNSGRDEANNNNVRHEGMNR